MIRLLSFGEKRDWSRTALLGLAALWLAAMVPGVRYLLAFERGAGAQGAIARTWPAGVPEIGEKGSATLAVTLHPRCSCSAATLNELEELRERTNARFQTVLYIYQPSGADDHWRDRALFAEAQEKLHATVVPDIDGHYAQAFQAMTSGEVLYYAPAAANQQRHLLFAGGVTAGRGMLGENAGIERLKAAMEHTDRTEDARAPVFGCSLFAFEKKDSETKPGKAKGAAQ